MDAVAEPVRPPVPLVQFPRPLFRPPAPVPHPTPLGLTGLLRTLRRNPLECWSRHHFEQPAVLASRALGHVVVLSDPPAIRRVLLDNAGNYRKDTLQRRVLSAGLAKGLLSAEGEDWRAQRRTLAPLFSRASVTGFATAMLDAAAALAERWHALCAEPPAAHAQYDAGGGARIDVATEMTRLTLDVLVRTIFSDGFGCDAEALRGAMATYFDTIGRVDPLDLLGVPRVVPRLTRLRARPALRLFDAAIDEIIATRRRRLARHPADAPNDILTLLLNALDPETGHAMTEAEVRSNILTFIAAGHETTANCLTWALYLLARSPEWRDRVAAEATREATTPPEQLADRLIETRAVLEESLRLYPPIAAISRAAKGPDELAGLRIRAGSLVVIAPWVLHRHRALWQAPDLFDPRRFLGEARTRIDRFAFLPFGAGMRTCIGAAFALQEAMLVLATLTREFLLEPVPEHRVWPLLRVTLRSEGGLPMVVRRRPRGPRHG